MTALERHSANMEAEIDPEPIERLRFFLSLALTGQDWIDVEQFIDGVSQQLASRDAEIAELVAALELLSKYIAYNGDDWVQRTALEALAKVRKP